MMGRTIGEEVPNYSVNKKINHARNRGHTLAGVEGIGIEWSEWPLPPGEVAKLAC